MTLVNFDIHVQMCCDKEGCEETTEIYKKDDFNIMMKEAKVKGWKIFKRDGIWIHFCKWVHT